MSEIDDFLKSLNFSWDGKSITNLDDEERTATMRSLNNELGAGRHEIWVGGGNVQLQIDVKKRTMLMDLSSRLEWDGLAIDKSAGRMIGKAFPRDHFANRLSVSGVIHRENERRPDVYDLNKGWESRQFEHAIDDMAEIRAVAYGVQVDLGFNVSPVLRTERGHDLVYAVLNQGTVSERLKMPLEKVESMDMGWAIEIVGRLGVGDEDDAKDFRSELREVCKQYPSRLAWI